MLHGVEDRLVEAPDRRERGGGRDPVGLGPYRKGEQREGAEEAEAGAETQVRPVEHGAVLALGAAPAHGIPARIMA